LYDIDGILVKMRGAIIGCGFFGGIQIEAWRRMPEIEIAIACDPDLHRARQFAPVAYASAEEMFSREKLDFVDIATRPEHHLSLVSLAMRAGVPAICQKPMAPSWAECIAMAEASETAGVRLMIHENWRWQPWYRAASEIIARGDIGRPVAYTFRTRKRDGLGDQPYTAQPYFRTMSRLLIYETLVHHIDTARYLFGEIQSVYAHKRTVNPLTAGEDQALLMLKHADDLPGIIDGHRFLNPEPDGPAMGEALFEGDAAALRLESTGDLYIGEKLCWKNQVSEGYRGDSVRRTQEHFIDCLRTGKQFESGARDYLRTVAAVEAAYKSADQRRAVRLDEIHATA
jgi:D-apiose dehydrogenase